MEQVLKFSNSKKKIFHMDTVEYCDILGHKWYNRCWRSYSPEIFIHSAEVVGIFFNILFSGLFIEMIQIALYFMEFEDIDELQMIFEKIHNLLVVPLCTILGLYMIFKQRRPCGIPREKGDKDIEHMKTIGPIYGMPSGDSLTSACFAAAFFPYSPLLSTALLILVPFSRIVRGYHSILQVTVGTIIGYAYGLAVIYGGFKFCIINWFFAATLPFLTLFDKNMKVQKKYDPSNFTTWMFSNTGMWIFDFLTSCPRDHDIFAKYGKQKMSIIAISITTFLRVMQFIGADRGWCFTFV